MELGTALTSGTGIPVRAVCPDGCEDAVIWSVDFPDGPEIHSSKEALLAALGVPRDWSFDRAFRLGPWSPSPVVPFPTFSPGGFAVLDPGPLLAPDVPLVLNEDVSVAAEVPLGNFFPSFETFWPPQSFDVKLSPDFGRKLGIDLAARGHEVRKLLFKGFGSWMFTAGHDPEEVFQEVCKGILARNRGRGAFDDRRSSFGHYVHNVCRCVLSNWHRREGRRRAHEQVGLSEMRDGAWTEVDAAEASPPKTYRPPEPHMGAQAVENDLQAFMRRRGAGRTPDGRLALEMLPLVVQGLGRGEIADELSPRGGKAAVGRAWALLKRHAAAWSKAD